MSARSADHPDIEQYIDSMWMEKGLSDNTLSSYRRDLRQFHEWLGLHHNRSIVSADRVVLQTYLGERLQQGQSPRSTARFMSCARGFYRYLLREGRSNIDPTLNVDSPKLGRPLPKSLSEEDVERLLRAPDLDVALEFRDRTMLELLYACGLRVTELTSLQVMQVSVNQGVVRVLGKGSKERLVPMGEEALLWLQRYMVGPRHELLKGIPSEVLFPSRRGTQMTRQTFWYRIKIYALRAEIKKDLSVNVCFQVLALRVLRLF